MDSFFAHADDLDKMLDEFERREETSDHGSRDTNQHLIPAVNKTNQSRFSSHIGHYNMETHSSPVDLIDLSDADFAPSPRLHALSIPSESDQHSSNTPVKPTGDMNMTTEQHDQGKSHGSLYHDINAEISDQALSSYLPTNLPKDVLLDDLQRTNMAANHIDRPGYIAGPVLSQLTSPSSSTRPQLPDEMRTHSAPASNNAALLTFSADVSRSDAQNSSHSIIGVQSASGGDSLGNSEESAVSDDDKPLMKAAVGQYMSSSTSQLPALNESVPSTTTTQQQISHSFTANSMPVMQPLVAPENDSNASFTSPVKNEVSPSHVAGTAQMVPVILESEPHTTVLKSGVLEPTQDSETTTQSGAVVHKPPPSSQPMASAPATPAQPPPSQPVASEYAILSQPVVSGFAALSQSTTQRTDDTPSTGTESAAMTSHFETTAGIAPGILQNDTGVDSSSSNDVKVENPTLSQGGMESERVHQPTSLQSAGGVTPVGFGDIDDVEVSRDEMEAFFESVKDKTPTQAAETSLQTPMRNEFTDKNDFPSKGDDGLAETRHGSEQAQNDASEQTYALEQEKATCGQQSSVSNITPSDTPNQIMSNPHANPGIAVTDHMREQPTITNGERRDSMLQGDQESSPAISSGISESNYLGGLHDSTVYAMQGLSLATAATTQSLQETTTAGIGTEMNLPVAAVTAGSGTEAVPGQYSQEITKPSDIENLRLQHMQQVPSGQAGDGSEQAQCVANKQSAMRRGLHLDFSHPSQRRVLAESQPPSQTIGVDQGVPPPGYDNELTEDSVNETEEHSDSIQQRHSLEIAAAESALQENSWNDHMPNRFNIQLPESAYQLGHVAPVWVPDPEAPNCMKCATKFTFTKRRHHCRACGKVFCSNCCNTKSKLKYMDHKEARVCVSCNSILRQVEAIRAMNSPGGAMRSPNPNNPAEYCSTVSPLEQMRHNGDQPPPSVMVPVAKSSLRRPNTEGSQRQRENRHVRFSDGIHPGGDLTDDSPSAVEIRPQRSQRRVRSQSNDAESGHSSSRTQDHASLIPEDGLPPVVINTGIKGEYTLEENPSPEVLMERLRSDSMEPVVFVVKRNLFVLAKIINLDCCVNRTCWCFTTKGMPIVGQDEIVIVLECLPQEKMVPRDIFCHFNNLYEEASKGNTVGDMGHTIFSQSFFGSREHGGMLYIRPTFQCVRKLLLPEPPYLFGVLLQKWETPWAIVFPVRLMLRLGAEYRYYPCPLMSVRFRKPVYGEIGHTIMQLLADFKNYQYMLPQIKGVFIHMEDRQTSINFPKNRYDDIMKVLNNSNEHVMALGSHFSTNADSHLVCIQNDDGHYQTQAINIQNKPRKVTGASFVVFNGALKSSSGLMAKSSIVEDGLMVQIPADTMKALRHALREMKDFTIHCGAIGVEHPEESVIVRWTEDDTKINVGVVSPIDGKSMEGIASLRIQNSTDYMGENRAIRWTEVFFLHNEESVGQRCDTVDLSRLAETLAQGCCMALCPHLDGLKESHMSKIGLRVTIGADRVGYEIGSNGTILPDKFMSELDNHLIPVITSAVSQQDDGPITMELVFYILE